MVGPIFIVVIVATKHSHLVKFLGLRVQQCFLVQQSQVDLSSLVGRGQIDTGHVLGYLDQLSVVGD
jgi:hypothetical protein